MAEPTVVVGKITKAHGLRGEVVVLVLSDNPDRFIAGASVFLEDGRELGVGAVRANGGRLLVSFHGVEDRTQAERLRGATLVVPTSMLPALPPGEYWPHRLIGCRVVSESGRSLGAIADVISTPANDLWAAVDEQGVEILIPALKEFVLDVNVDERLVRVIDHVGLTVPEDEG